MARTPARAAACACLLRAIVAMLARCDPTPQLRHWEAALHDRFALPFHLRRIHLATGSSLCCLRPTSSDSGHTSRRSP